MIVAPEAEPGPTNTEQAPSITSVDRLLIVPELHPIAEVTIDDRVFALSAVVQSYNYDRAVMYTQTETSSGPRVVPRLLYKSNSDGGWRAAYTTIGGAYHKAVDTDGHYVQETKLHTGLLGAIDELPRFKDVDEGIGERIERIFGEPAYMEAFTAFGEITYFKETDLDNKLVPFRLLKAGQFTYHARILAQVQGCDSIGEYFTKANDAFLELPGFVPDFSGKPLRTVRQQHTLLGETHIEEYEALIGNEPIVWSMAQDAAGRTWVENIRLQRNNVTSYGTYSVIFDGGFLTSKPLDYKRNVDGLITGREALAFNRRYMDITPVLSNILPIAQYKRLKEEQNNT